MDLAPHPLAERCVNQLVAREAAPPLERRAHDARVEVRLVRRLDHDLGSRERGADQLGDLGGMHEAAAGWDMSASYITLPPRYHAAPMCPPPASPPDDTALLATARRTLASEQAGIAALVTRLDARFAAACRALLACEGRVVVCGMGKSGHIAGKIAATLASTGTPAFFLHPAEAGHGDLGMITRPDVLLALSNSGETAEILVLLPHVKRLGVPVIALTGRADSPLAQAADIVLDVSVDQEACPHNLAPTTSTTAALAMGDALAVAVLEARGFSAEEFALRHPGGSLGRRLLLRVADLMRTGTALPRVGPDTLLAAGLVEMSAKGLGLTAVVDDADQVLGVFTDGDLRRALDRHLDLHATTMRAAMTTTARTIDAQQLAAAAARLMEQHRVTALLVVDADRRLIGALNVHDLMRAGVV
jgi:arabinose-5-phosphate isomerase